MAFSARVWSWHENSSSQIRGAHQVGPQPRFKPVPQGTVPFDQQLVLCGQLSKHTSTHNLYPCTHHAAAPAARKAAAAAAEARVAAEFEAKRPVDPEVPAAAPWRFNNVSIHSIEHIKPPVGEYSSYCYSPSHRYRARQWPSSGAQAAVDTSSWLCMRCLGRLSHPAQYSGRILCVRCHDCA